MLACVVQLGGHPESTAPLVHCWLEQNTPLLAPPPSHLVMVDVHHGVGKAACAPHHRDGAKPHGNHLQQQQQHRVGWGGQGRGMFTAHGSQLHTAEVQGVSVGAKEWNFGVCVCG